MAYVYTNSEMCDMHFVYGQANGNSSLARRLYEEKYPQRVIPHHGIFARLHQRLAETGKFSKNTTDVGASVKVTPEEEEAVLNYINENPTTSIRKMALALNLTHSTIWRLLKKHLLYPYHIQKVHALLPTDFPLRVAFCRWFQDRIRANRPFLAQVCFTDEANFSRDAIINFHNDHWWAQENPHAYSQNNHQQQFSVNVWVGIIGDYLIGPYFLPRRLNGEAYQQFLQDELPQLLEDVPLVIRNAMVFMHDGAPAHFSRIARQHLDNAYPNRWIGRGGPYHWPPRSPDLNPLDFFLWGHLKSLVYATPVNNCEELKNRITARCEQIRDTPGILERVRESMRRRVQACIDANGSHFQHLL